MLIADLSPAEILWHSLGNVHGALEHHPVWAGTILVGTSVLSGMIVGLERERKDKPAGMRTVALICTGSTIFTLASVYAGDAFHADRSRIAAQIVTGIGFLGAGAIIRERGRIIGMTTGATVWAVAAIGVLIGMGYAAAGLVLSLVIIAVLSFAHHAERLFIRPCIFRRCRIFFESDGGKMHFRIRRLLDAFEVPQKRWNFTREGDREVLDLDYCTTHPQHRIFMGKLADMKHVHEIRED